MTAKASLVSILQPYNYDYDQMRSSDTFCKKKYLSYTKKEGLTIVELGIIQRIFRKVFRYYDNTHLYHVCAFVTYYSFKYQKDNELDSKPSKKSFSWFSRKNKPLEEKVEEKKILQLLLRFKGQMDSLFRSAHPGSIPVDWRGYCPLVVGGVPSLRR
jgi:hypothetical protein